ncbi:hyaluronan and proteoglycan link protein 1-like [Girardinichthys multiradiatus]|uniref:hyaluronan and proteoglycan link protein 1-like n=1 Tax=Girardinichthys multiradiatus TaxID=208333 RepID=UPI001FAD7793|nr:hyaluronan and proteoglycan link protein 1-like [Girardinichthys multiradiatus]
MISLVCITIISLTLAGSAYCQMATPSSPKLVKTELGGNVTLPCKFESEDSFFFGSLKVTWTKVAEDESQNEDVLVSIGLHKRTYGNFETRAFLVNLEGGDASLVLTEVSMEDMGRYRCEVIDGMEDIIQDVILEVENGLTEGVVFPYSPHRGRYNLNFVDAVQTCASQDAVIASFDQLLEAWKDGLDWCNAGWLSDGTVQYPITKPRQPCGGTNSNPGVRNYGRRNKRMSRFDVFCYASKLKGHFYWLVQPDRLSFDEAVQACRDENAEIAKVGHMYAAWKLEAYDRCDAGWLADGSVRYPISRPRKNCSPTEAAVRFVAFPDKKVKSYGVYCFKAYQ